MALKSLSLLILAVALSTQALAQDTPEWRHGLAMHGAPALPEGFPHLPYVNPEAPSGGQLDLAAIGGYDSLNRFGIRGRKAEGLHLLHDPLMARVWSEPFSLYALVAEAVQMPEDRSWILFRLDPRARFHDGAPITAADVIWTFETLRAQGPPSFRTNYAQVAAVSQPAPGQIRFDFAEGTDREVPLILATMPILPRHDWVDEAGEPLPLDRGRLEDPPLGSGPYRIAEVEPGRMLAYERVEDYWARDHPLARGQFNPDAIVYRYFRDDSVAFEAFKAGDVDLRREQDAARLATAYDFQAVVDGRVIVEALPHARPEWTRALIFNARLPIFADRRTRQALTLALDFEWINRTLLHGQYRRIESLYPNAELAASGLPAPAELRLLEPFRAMLPEAVFGPAWTAPVTDGSGPRGQRRHLREAAGLLDAAGWRLEEGRRVDAEGQPFAFEILLSSPGDERVALEYARALERLGIEARIRTADSAEFVGRLESFDFEMTLHRWISTLSPGTEQRLYWGSAAAERPGSRNYAGIASPAVDHLIDAMVESRTREELLAAAHALDRVIMHGAWFVPLHYDGTDRVARWVHLQHPGHMPLYGMVLESWWLEPAALP